MSTVVIVLAQWPKATEVVYEQGMLKARPSDPLGKSCLSINVVPLPGLGPCKVERTWVRDRCPIAKTGCT